MTETFLGVNDATNNTGSYYSMTWEEVDASSSSTMDDDYYQSQISTLTDGQEIALNVLRFTTSALSIFGSVTIMYKVIRNRQHTTPYDRIMLGLSLADIIASLSFMMGPFLLPSDTSQRVWAIGTTSTCSFLGWMSQLGLSAVWYNCLLSFYYLFTVRLGMSRHVFAQKYEKWFHLSAWIFFLTTASLGSAFHWYGEFQINQGCWLKEIPQGCEANGTCTGKGLLVGWFFAGIPTVFTFLALIINNLFIYAHVRKAMSPASSKASLTNKNGTTNPSPGTGTSQLEVTSVRDQPSSHRHQQQQQQLQQQSQSPREETEPGIHYIEEVRRLRHQAQIKEVATQGFLYVVTFFLSYTPAFAVRMIDGVGMGASKEDQIYPLLVLNAFLLPLQGFFNMFVHTRPSYFRFRAAYPEFSRTWAMSHALFDKDIPRYSKAKFTTKGLLRDHNVEGGGGSRGVHWRVSSSHNSHSGSWYSSSYCFSSNLDPVEEEKSEEEDYTANSHDLDRCITFVVAAAGLPSEMTSISFIEDDFEESPKQDNTLNDTNSPTMAALLQCIPVHDVGTDFSSDESSVATTVEVVVSMESGTGGLQDPGAAISQAST